QAVGGVWARVIRTHGVAVMMKNILLPTDGTQFCDKAVKYGVALAKTVGAKVTGVTVMAPMRQAMQVGLSEGVKKEMMVQRSNHEKLALANVVAAAQDAGVAFETVSVTDEHVYRGVLDTAKDKGCDLIVMASHGRRGVAALMLGSETQKVVVHSDIPVLVVR